MIKLLRHIRKSLLEQNKMSKYFKYAIGEILLVVIGILIALQINNWNQNRLDRKKEMTYLSELQTSLKKDIEKINNVLGFNVKKDSIVFGLMGIFKSELNNEQRFELIEKYSTPFTSYEFFTPNSTTWDNLIASENINLIKDKNLRIKLMEYYNPNYEGSIQERIKTMNRKVIDENFPKFFTREYTKKNLNLDTEFPTLKEFALHHNQKLLSDLYGIRYLINMQNGFLEDTKSHIESLIKVIDQQKQ